MSKTTKVVLIVVGAITAILVTFGILAFIYYYEIFINPLPGV